MTMIRRVYWILYAQLGINPIMMLRSLFGLSRYVVDFFQFRTKYTGRIELLPCLHDWHEEGGSTQDEYFWQDLYIAQKIYIANPKKHVDIGSRIDGFVAHVASFRAIEVFDIRPVTSDVPNIVFKQADLMNPSQSLVQYCDSVSCLHALEHFGLGRYGDPINPLGYEAGLKNMTNILQQHGLFYLSVPIGIARVEFNAHRVFDPNEILRLAEDNGLLLEEFAWVQSGVLTKSENPVKNFEELACSRYALGIFTFRKHTSLVAINTDDN
ncbi:MAG: DUF268 domain-containing protein [Methylococcaceae bacterium]|nr:DUF268 domain-containing protein [Methylococcaceae bacterium]MDD1608918.1 DUF268 domain-containing protein [Methylococcaceae bacterium]